MSLVLSLPGVAVVLFLGRGYHGSIRLAWLMFQVQLAIGIPFLMTNWQGYVGRAFDLSRQFLFRWTVNWRFVGEDLFLSKSFTVALLALHAAVLVLFVMTRWLKPARQPASKLVKSLLCLRQPLTNQQEVLVSRNLSPRFIVSTILTANVVGLLFARSLHYQFYAYVAWSTPFLLWRSGIHPVLLYVLWGIQEWAWNVYPSTSLSSAVVVGSLALAVLLVYLGAREEWEEMASGKEKDDSAKK